jgi:hypothetical protein
VFFIFKHLLRLNSKLITISTTGVSPLRFSDKEDEQAKIIVYFSQFRGLLIMEQEYKGKKILPDPSAGPKGQNSQAFVAQSMGKPLYQSFPVVAESETDGWMYGAITDHKSEDGITYGNGYVIAPDGSQAGIIWDLASPDFSQIYAPEEIRWGVYGVRFQRPVKSVEDIVYNFRAMLPKLKEQYAKIKGGKT